MNMVGAVQLRIQAGVHGAVFMNVVGPVQLRIQAGFPVPLSPEHYFPPELPVRLPSLTRPLDTWDPRGQQVVNLRSSLLSANHVLHF